MALRKYKRIEKIIEDYLELDGDTLLSIIEKFKQIIEEHGEDCYINYEYGGYNLKDIQIVGFRDETEGEYEYRKLREKKAREKKKQKKITQKEKDIKKMQDLIKKHGKEVLKEL